MKLDKTTLDALVLPAGKTELLAWDNGVPRFADYG